ncbi:sulfatase family protein [Propionibacteriaceae bacterium Y1700]|uniref:sulfatase family protein n=1 Tax=Microlunatus sp. Y1700 TaxID=3418487 RepID=UPI003DA78347
MPPAILFITTDQLRRDALGCFGGRAVPTPHLDALAASGIRFDRAHTASPWCLPSRSAMITGRYPRNNGAYSNFRDNRLSPDTPNLYNSLGALGYEVSHVGKCHYAPVPYGDTRPDVTLPYEEFREYYLSLGIDHLDLQDDKQVSVWFRDDYAAELDEAGHLAAYREAVWDGSKQKVFTFPGPAEWHPDAWVGRKAVERINAASPDRDHFLWASFSGPHFPFDPPAEHLDRVDLTAMGEPFLAGELEDPERIHHWSLHGAPGRWIESGRNDRFDDDYWHRLRHHYFANLALLDDQIGAVIAAAEKRFGDDLLVVFTPDHGEMLGNHGMWGKGNCFYSDVLEVPLLVRPPGPPAPRHSDDLVSLIDLFPTMINCAGGDPGDVDGVDLLSADPGHRYVFSEGEGFQTVTDGRHKLVTITAHGRTMTELFDLASDPHEVTTVHADPAYAEIRAELAQVAQQGLMETALP